MFSGLHDMPSFLLLFHANNTLNITFKHETITPRIFRYVSPFFQNYAWSYTRIFGNSKFSTKTEIMLIFVRNKRVLEIQVIPWKGNHTPRKKKQKETPWSDSKSWVLFEWIMRSHVAYRMKARLTDPKCMSLKWRKAFFDNPFTRLKYIICSPLLSLMLFLR